MDFSTADFVSAFDEAAQRCVAAFRADGVMEKMLVLPFGLWVPETRPGILSRRFARRRRIRRAAARLL